MTEEKLVQLNNHFKDYKLLKTVVEMLGKLEVIGVKLTGVGSLALPEQTCRKVEELIRHEYEIFKKRFEDA